MLLLWSILAYRQQQFVRGRLLISLPFHKWRDLANLSMEIEWKYYPRRHRLNLSKFNISKWRSCNRYMTSSLACANPQTATSTGYTMTVTSTLPPSVYLESSFTTICAGTMQLFMQTRQMVVLIHLINGR